jgi:predicted ribonuclease YlaK
MEGYIPGKRKSGRPKLRWVQDITDNLEMSASNVGHFAYE